MDRFYTCPVASGVSLKLKAVEVAVCEDTAKVNATIECWRSQSQMRRNGIVAWGFRQPDQPDSQCIMAVRCFRDMDMFIVNGPGP